MEAAVQDESKVVWTPELFDFVTDALRTVDENYLKHFGTNLAANIEGDQVENPNIAAAALDQIREMYWFRFMKDRMKQAPLPERNAEPVPAAAKGLDETKLGTFTVEWSDGTYNTIRIKEGGEGSKLAGKVIAEFLSGPDNTNSFTGFAFVNGNNVSIWNRYRGFEHIQKAQALAAILNGGKEENLDRREGYARRSGKCSRCGRTLTVPASLNRGMGSECASKVGL